MYADVSRQAHCILMGIIGCLYLSDPREMRYETVEVKEGG